MKKKTNTPSVESQQEALKIAKATQKPAQTKEQTKLIAQGIEKGIALYKKQQKERGRQADKAKKRVQKEKQTLQTNQDQEQNVDSDNETTSNHASKLPWLLLFASWIGFAIYLMK
ncbi:DUF2956 domain-containing protein [Vibrio splendidus]|uniref:DUF2956 domain-containing protein n=1 Tax=Vibrio splendidus TaxID=29497 RepID=A0ABD5A4S0_VIBSP|nr:MULTISPECIES: DUF2956 domain-containing protein [Vibrio]MBO7911908.1 DUF2956 domain-containing protein [Vibrio sp. G41H]MCC5516071.1 DUF2956 domain-containing protein [Vibrio splendidus]MCF7491721.1 DUF2956 domain-containing protein [Vibrio sp. G-C-1]MCW4440553.1 DUF2956 domain-containing protein [Vibrio splendidus]MCW4445701.1 DUF2956 domain-containing protein [Vibrio splendidus]